MTAPQAILSENPKRKTESEEGYRLRVLSWGMRTAYNDAIHSAELLILAKQKKAKGPLENELSNLLLELYETKMKVR